MMFDDTDKKADARMEQLFEIIKVKDKDALKDLFSKQALSEADDLDEKLDAIFSYIQGEIQSWNSQDALIGHEGKNALVAEKEFQAAYIITTSKQIYHVAIYECTLATANPNNVGVYSICIVSDEDYDYGNTEMVYWGDGDVAGIYIGNRK